MKKPIHQENQANQTAKNQKKNRLKEIGRETVIRFDEARCISYQVESPKQVKGGYRVKFPHFFMLFVLEGRISIQTGVEEERCINRNEFFCTYHNEGDYKLVVYPGKQHVVTLVFEPYLFEDPASPTKHFPSIWPLIEAMLAEKGGVSSKPVIKMRKQTIRHITALLALDKDKTPERSQKAYAHILSIVREYHEGVCAIEKNPSLDLSNLLKIYIDSHIDKPEIQVKLLSQQFSGSERTLQRKFQEAYDCSIKNYIIQQRMEKAIQLLKEKVPIGNVLPQVGYSDQHSFSVQFKKHHGFPPSAV